MLSTNNLFCNTRRWLSRKWARLCLIISLGSLFIVCLWFYDIFFQKKNLSCFKKPYIFWFSLNHMEVVQHLTRFLVIGLFHIWNANGFFENTFFDSLGVKKFLKVCFHDFFLTCFCNIVSILWFWISHSCTNTRTRFQIKFPHGI